ncbi:hypothetical protein [Moheibacter sediminis]|uniref:Uncharacterized protein n=1 Tax=Moheibacter sediminis TaxID=1434700 RepID=A0A1W2C9P1_9FLAO|nr:hypothetical protein [Moheibacter sediminis]SMC81408.1 hypothetical protein SAMN06296427_10988 [Moheibacter sediminis]
MKVLFYLSFIASLLFVSCSGDDDSVSDPEAQIPAEEKLLETVKMGTEDIMQFTYNPDKTVNELTIPNFALLNFAYEQGNIKSITAISGGTASEYIFDYENGKISSFSLGDEVTNVTYNAAGNYYLYQNEYQEEFTIELYDNGDIKKRVVYDNVNDEILSSHYFIYDNTKMGTMSNSNAVNVHLSMIMGSFWEILGIPITKKPVKTISVTQGNIAAENTFDNQGFVKSTFLSLGQEDSLNFAFTYTQLEN